MKVSFKEVGTGCDEVDDVELEERVIRIAADLIKGQRCIAVVSCWSRGSLRT